MLQVRKIIGLIFAFLWFEAVIHFQPCKVILKAIQSESVKEQDIVRKESTWRFQEKKAFSLNEICYNSPTLLLQMWFLYR